MKPQDKIDAIEPLVLALFADGYSLDEVCSRVVSDALDRGIAFGEILPLVNTIGKAGGYITELADRKANLLLDLAPYHAPQADTYANMMDFSERLAKEYDVPVKYSLSAIKIMLKEEGLPIPTKPVLSGWRLSAMDCWRDYIATNDTPDVQDVRKWLRTNDHNHSSYTQAYHELYTELVNLKEEVK